MESKHLDAVQVIILVGQLLSERKHAELGDLARQDVRVFEQLVDTLRGGKGLFCFSAAASLVEMGDRALVPLLDALGDKKYVVRQASAFALGDLGDRGAVAALIGRLADPSDAVRLSAAVALGKLGVQEAVEPLIQAMGDESELVRQSAINGLGTIGDKRALPALRRAAARDTVAVAQRAQAVMQEIGDDAMPWWRRLWQKKGL